MNDTLVEGPSPPDPSLGHKVRTGLRWSLLNLFVNKGLSIVSGVILARILAPEDFGVYAIAIGVVNILFGLNDLGLVIALIRWQEDLRDAARTAMTIATVSSGVIYLACFALAPAFADALGAPHVVGVLRVLALTVLIDGLVSVPHGLLVRSFRQDALAKIQFISSPANFGTAVALGALGAGPWSLAMGNVAGNCVAAVAFWWYSPMRPGFGYQSATARKLLSFGIPMAGTSVVEYVLLNADYVIVGLILGPVEAGFYLLAYNVSNWVVAALTDAVRPVALA
ncbi:MAG: oligosaccharide flippase family protein, partial [Acidimicrobiales bacterium]